MNVFQYIDALDSLLIAHAAGAISNENLTLGTEMVVELFNAQPKEAISGVKMDSPRFFAPVEAAPQRPVVIQCAGLDVTYRDGSSGFYQAGEGFTVEREGDRYTIFSHKGGPAFSYEAGHACVTSVKVRPVK
jgi:hypothetical protein